MLSKEDFEKDIGLREQYGGEYEKYKQAGGTYNFNDVTSVANTGKLPQRITQKDDLSAYYTQVYNDAVNKNNAMARNQALNAGSEYREINRNINEINKAQGTANTGYAGDTSIDAYNAYINTVNSAYNDANNTNNELYSYYLDQMAQERDRQDANETKVVSALSEILSDKYSDGYVSEDAINTANSYLESLYGKDLDDKVKIPDRVQAYLNTVKGYGDYIKNSGDYITSHDYDYKEYDITLVGGKGKRTISDESGDVFKIRVGTGKDAKDIKMVTTTNISDSTDEKIQKLKEQLDKIMPEQAGTFVKYNGKYYVRAEGGDIYEAKGKNSTVTI